MYYIREESKIPLRNDYPQHFPRYSIGTLIRVYIYVCARRDPGCGGIIYRIV